MSSANPPNASPSFYGRAHPCAIALVRRGVQELQMVEDGALLAVARAVEDDVATGLRGMGLGRGGRRNTPEDVLADGKRGRAAAVDAHALRAAEPLQEVCAVPV